MLGCGRGDSVGGTLPSPSTLNKCPLWSWMGQLLADREENKVTTKALVRVQQSPLSPERHRFSSGCPVGTWLGFVGLGSENSSKFPVRAQERPLQPSEVSQQQASRDRDKTIYPIVLSLSETCQGSQMTKACMNSVLV